MDREISVMDADQLASQRRVLPSAPAEPGRAPGPADLAEPSAGLTAIEAERRLARSGPNEVESRPRFWALRPALEFATNPLVLILLAASLVSGLLGEVLNATLITAMVVLSVGLNFYQVFNSELAARTLRSMVALTTSVWRDGRLEERPVRDIVPGDLLEIRAGDLVPADATMVTAATISVDEAALTGESLPVERRAGAGSDGRLFAGTSVVSGISQAVVTATGRRTQFGAIAHALVEKAPPTEFELGARRFGMLIMRTVVGLVLFVFLVNALLRRDPLESLLFALALAVGLTPEFLPMIMTVTLSRGAQRMAQGKVIVKRLAAIEHLGNMDILCSDKTGTLTRGAVTLAQYVDAAGAESANVLRLACVNSALESGIRSPLDAAILAHEHPAIADFAKRSELSFDFERRRVSVLVDGSDGRQVVTKGAPEGVLALCTQADRAGVAVPLDAAVRAEAERTFERLSQVGYHLLAVASRPATPEQDHLVADDERDLVLAGFVAFLDPPDPSARETLGALRASGVRVKILTGDGELITRTICDQVGLPTESIVLGDEIERMSDDALGAVAERTDVFARVTPTQKNRIIRALKRKGHVVGYIGDGINDAPSLHAADVGISVSNGVDVAKAAADVILLEKSLAAVQRGVVEGRKSFGNITKYVLMGTSSNFGNMLSMAVAAALLPFLPLLPAQILLNNFLYDLSQLTIPTDNVDASYLSQPRKWDMRLIQRFMFGLGPISSLYDLFTFGVLLGVFQVGPEMFRAGWFIESLATQTLVIFVIRTAGNPFRSRPSRALVLSVLGSVLAGLAVVVGPFGRDLGFDALPPAYFLALALLVVTYLGLVQLFKRRFYRVSR
jgi:P-type Mg2+ transporter